MGFFDVFGDALHAATNAVGLTSDPSLVNANGDKLSDVKLGSGGVGDVLDFRKNPEALTLLTNWLTAGGAPKPLDPSKLFGDAQALAPVEARAAAGRGVAGLFGFGKSIGEMQPQIRLPSAPLAPGVPYSAKPIPPVGG